MNALRLYRCRIGLFLVAMMFAAAGLPGVLAAAQGIQLQVPICGPGDVKFSPDPGPAADSHNDHCKIFPCGAALSAGDRDGAGLITRQALALRSIEPTVHRPATGARAELSPLKGRAPPSQS